jgi:chemotaxis protein MotB
MRMRGKTDKKGKAEILIRKEEVIEGEAHGGSWKVAYADFVTAMMAFFLLMWLLNATTEEQRKGLADYSACCRTIRPAPASQSAAARHSPKARCCRISAIRR